MKQAACVLMLLAAAVGLAGCATTKVPVTGINKEDPSWDGSQSETAISVANFAAKSVITVAFNDENPTQMKIDYTPTTRTVHKGASLMGWAYSENGGTSVCGNEQGGAARCS